MTVIALVGFLVFTACVSGQQQNYVDYEYQAQSRSPSAGASRAEAAAIKPTPVPIIKQINRHNDDGSYTYGYEGADGSFKIETKLPTGEVSGKYGYVDDTGKLRVVDYGANKYGFQPAGDGITVAPPTLVDETTDKTKQNDFAEFDDEGVLYGRPQPQPQSQVTVGRPAPRPSKKSKAAAPRPVQYVATAQPQFLAFEPAPRVTPTRAPAPTAIPVQHFQALQQQAQFPQHFATQFQHPAPAQFQQQAAAQFHQEATPQFHQPAAPQFQQPSPTHFPQVLSPQLQQQFQPTFVAYEQPRQVAAAPRVAPASRSPTPARAVVPGASASGPLFRPSVLPAPVSPQRPAPVREHQGRQSGSVLDSLIEQYALPQGVGQPLHDITFGSYSSQTSF